MRAPESTVPVAAVSVTIPLDLLRIIAATSRDLGVSRSRVVAALIRQGLTCEQEHGR